MSETAINQSQQVLGGLLDFMEAELDRLQAESDAMEDEIFAASDNQAGVLEIQKKQAHQRGQVYMLSRVMGEGKRQMQTILGKEPG